MKERNMGDGPKVLKFYRVPWPMRLLGARRVPKGIVPTDDPDLQRLLAKAHAVEELPADHPDVQAALAVRSAEVAFGGKAAQVLDRVDGDWREKARAVGAKHAAAREEQRAATERQQALQRAADAGDVEGVTVPPASPAPPSPTPAIMAHLPEGFAVNPGEALAAAGVPGAVGVFTPSALAAGAQGGVAPTPEVPSSPGEPVAASGPAPAAEQPKPEPEAEPAPGVLMPGEPENGFAYMTKSQLKEWLQKNATSEVPTNGSKQTLEKLCRGVLGDLNRAKQAGR